MRNRRGVLAVFCPVFFFLAALRASPAEIPPFSVDTTQMLALGAYHSAYNTGLFSLFSNPAALGSIQYSGTFQLGAGMVSDPAEYIALLSAIAVNAPFGQNALNAYGKKNPAYTPPELYLNGPFAAGYAAKGAGAGFFNRVFFDSAVHKRKWTMNLNTDFLGIAGASVCLVDNYIHKLDIGFSAKLSFRYVYNMVVQDIAVNTAYNGPGEAPDRADKIVLGAGLHAGILYTAFDFFSLGIDCADAATPYLFVYLAKQEPGAPDFQLAYQKLNIGVSFKALQTGSLVWHIMGDFRDILSLAGVFGTKPKHPALHISAGTELIVWGRLSLRLGFKDMLPSAGIGYSFERFGIDAAFYGKEYGLSPGDNYVYAFDIGFRFYK